MQERQQPDPNTFHGALVKARGDKPQTAIASTLGVSQAAVSSWEASDEESRLLPRAERLDAIASAYGIKRRRLRALWHRAAASRSSAAA